MPDSQLSLSVPEAIPESYSARITSGFTHAYPAAVAAAGQVVLHPQEAEDVVQSALAHLLVIWSKPKGRLEFPRDDEHFKALLLTCVVNRAITAGKQIETLADTRKGELNGDTPLHKIFQWTSPLIADSCGHDRNPLELDRREEDRQILASFVNQHVDLLPARTREVVLLVYHGRMKRAAVSRRLGISPRTFDWHIEEAGKQLRRTLIEERPHDAFGHPEWYEPIWSLHIMYEKKQARRRELKLQRGVPPELPLPGDLSDSALVA